MSDQQNWPGSGPFPGGRPPAEDEGGRYQIGGPADGGARQGGPQPSHPSHPPYGGDLTSQWPSSGAHQAGHGQPSPGQAPSGHGGHGPYPYGYQQPYPTGPYGAPVGPQGYPGQPYGGSAYGQGYGAQQYGAPPVGGPPPYGMLPPAAIPPSPPGGRHGSRAMRAGAAALVLVAAVVAGAGLGRAIWPSNTSSVASGPTATPTTTPSSGANGGTGSGSGLSPFFGDGGTGGTPGGTSEGAGGPSDVSAIAAKVDPALVDVNDVFDYESAEGAGTGIVLTSNGEILTNNHVIDGETKLSVTDVGNGKTYSATVVGYDSTHDVAVIQLQGASGLKTAKISAASPSVGEAVVAIGNAGGTGGTPTSAGGSITALDQSITASDDLTDSSEQLSGLIETNANVESGDSGGSLVNASGQVIGMDTAASEGFNFSSSGNEGFAIPISEAMTIAKEIEAGKGSATVHVGATAFLGVKVNATEQSASSGSGFGSGIGTGGTGGFGYADVTGAQICDITGCVVDGAPAQKAGLEPGDVITSLGGKKVTSSSDLTHLLVPYHPGQKVEVGWVDAEGNSHRASITLASGPPA